jgi:adenylate kinase family enzyme
MARAGSVARIHVFGASGSGTTTLSRALATRLDVRHFDADDYFWQPTEPPFTQKYPPEKRVELLAADLDRVDAWVLSGSMCGWGDVFAQRFTLAVYLWIPGDVRMQRIALRETQRYGARIDPGGDMHEQSREFLEWARRYDSAGFEQRSRVLHDWWIGNLSCPVLRIDYDAPTDVWADAVLERLDSA